MKRLVLYHADADGFASAYCAWRVFGRKDTDYLSTNYGEAVVDVDKYDKIVMLDFSYKRSVLEEMNYLLGEGNLLVLDHHKSAEEDLEGLDYCRFDGSKSGATLSWAYFNNYNPHVKCPPLLLYVEDFDLWKFQMGESTRNIAACLEARASASFEEWHEWITDWPFWSAHLHNEGAAIVRFQDEVVKRVTNTAHVQTWVVDGKIVDIPIVNTRECISRIGNVMAKGHPFAASYFDVGGNRHWSLRSDDNGWDVSEVAKMKGGGGHKNAAGFETFDDEGPILTFKK